MIIPPVQLREAVGRICSGCVMCFPYDGRFIFLNEAMSDRIRKDVSVLEKVDATSIGMRPSVGGAFLVNEVPICGQAERMKRFMVGSRRCRKSEASGDIRVAHCTCKRTVISSSSSEGYQFGV